MSPLSAHGVPVEAIALLAGHNQTATTELVYRHQIVPALSAASRSWIRSSISASETSTRRRCKNSTREASSAKTWKCPGTEESQSSALTS